MIPLGDVRSRAKRFSATTYRNIVARGLSHFALRLQTCGTGYIDAWPSMCRWCFVTIVGEPISTLCYGRQTEAGYVPTPEVDSRLCCYRFPGTTLIPAWRDDLKQPH